MLASVSFFFLTQLMHRPAHECTHDCMLAPWALLFVLNLVCSFHKSTTHICNDLLLMGLLITAFAIHLSHGDRAYAHACSLYGVLLCAQQLSSDTTTLCVLSLASLICLPVYLRYCSYAIPFYTQLCAIAWAEGINAAHWVLIKIL